MHAVRRYLSRLVIAALVIAACLGVADSRAAQRQQTPEGARLEAADRWAASGLQSYEIAVQVEIRGELCVQRIVVDHGAEHKLTDTCASSWLNALTVPQLFDLVGQIEAISDVRCQPTVRDCPCQRVFSSREVHYNPTLGYPELLLTRSDIRPNVFSPDYLINTLEHQELPNCAAAPRILSVRTLWLAPR